LTTTLDIRCPIVPPGRIPIHHQHQLLASLSRIVPEIHALRTVGVHPIRGTRIAPGLLELDRRSAVMLRASAGLLPRLVLLGGKKLDIGGCLVRLGVPQLFGLSPAACVRADLVTIKGYLEKPTFETAVRRQLDALGTSNSVRVEVGGRHIIQIRGQAIVGFSLRLGGLSEDESIRVQQIGLGGRRHFGCGLFQPAPRELKA
jgi:CRISPR-associated protein Cas6